MLSEINITNLAIIDAMNLKLAPGLNIITGETGSGKSILVDAITLMLGGRADNVMIRSDSDYAIIEGVFQIDSSVENDINDFLSQDDLENVDNTETLILSRELRRKGRNISRVNGRSVKLSMLRDLGNLLVDLHSQSEHLSLLKVSEHLPLLDRYGGLDQDCRRFGEIVSELKSVRKMLVHAREEQANKKEKSELLRFQFGEISEANLTVGEDISLKAERLKLSNIEKLIKFSNQLLEVGIESDSQSRGMSVVDQIGMMSEICERLIQIDANFQPIKSQVDSLFDQCQDVASDLFKYKDNIEFDPERFVEVEERLELISDLIGKYGSNIDDVIQYGLDIELKLENIASNADSIEELENKEKVLLDKIENLGIEITKKRKLTADSLESNVMERMSELRMDGTEFFIHIDHTDDDISGVTIDNRIVKIYENGLDTVEFFISPNKGESLKPISKIASGGETSRLMLALRGILAEADRRPILVFDEIDQGIGGRIGSVIGKNLWELGGSHQVVCITHLPSIAGYGDAHYRVTKQMSDDRTYTVVESLDSESRIEEIIAMLGSEGKSVRKTALVLIENANKQKTSI
tara:strand:+ start:3041 stop:4783 length:1743 start_codon:yes stop_codon:yes gene_type:complete